MTVESASFEQQYQALRNGGAMVELTGWSSVTLTGADRQTFLHNFCTNDVKRLVPGTSCEAFITNVKGKIVGHGLITCRDDELVVIGAPNQGSELVAHLDRYVIREDVVLQDTTSERAYVLVAGGEELARKFRYIVSLLREKLMLREIGWDLLPQCFCQILEVNPHDQAQLRQALLDHGAPTCDEAAFQAVRIESGTPLFGLDFDDRNFPQEIGRDKQAISFTKGCYLGQETVARIDALGHVNRQILGVSFAGQEVPSAGMELSFAGTSVGHVTSATYSPQIGAPLALAMVRREWSAPGSKLESSVGECKVVALPVGAGGS